MDHPDAPQLPDGLRFAPLEDRHAAAATLLGHEAFSGGPRPTGDDLPTELWRTGLTWTGVFDDEQLVAVVRDRHDASWFGGARISTAGIAGVCVRAEHRGGGLLRPMMAGALRLAAERGAAVSTLFPTAAGIYRGLGYEVIGSQDTIELDTASLGRVRTDGSIRLRRATADDFPAVQGIYAEWASRNNGPLTRDSELFGSRSTRFPDDFTGVTLACDSGDPGSVLGFCSWNRTGGYTGEGRVEVADLVARTEPARRSLLAMLGTFGAVAERITLDTSGVDPVSYLLPSAASRRTQCDPYMLRVLDPVAALEARNWPAVLDGAVTLELEDAILPEAAGRWRVEWHTGKATVQRDSGDVTDPVRLGPRGLALLYAGAQPPAELRSAGLLDGGSEADDELLTLAFGGRPVHIRDYF